MVWFQCESCGENLKKPKLQNHFRGCAARKLSCIDCGVVFDQQSVQLHTSCVSETEKYGPKTGNSCSALKPKCSQAHKAGDLDLSVGLSTYAPWSCSLCKVNATSYETLEGHSQGKKHRAKAKAAQARVNSLTIILEGGSKESNSRRNDSDAKSSAEADGSKPVEDGKPVPSIKGDDEGLKKRKAGGEGEDKLGEKRKKFSKGQELLDAAANEGVVTPENEGGEKLEVAKSATSLLHFGKAVKWKKLTTTFLLKAPEKSIKIKELFKELLPVATLGEDNLDKKTLEKQLVERLNASSKFNVRGKWVVLATPS